MHARGVVYRDLKTANWVVDENLLPLLIDFGTARALAPQAVSGLSYGIGTTVYGPPEILTEERSRSCAGTPMSKQSAR
jgi:serine/threonine protein kinase